MVALAYLYSKTVAFTSTFRLSFVTLYIQDVLLCLVISYVSKSKSGICAIQGVAGAILTIQLVEIFCKKNFDEAPKIHQYFPSSKLCTIWY